MFTLSELTLILAATLTLLTWSYMWRVTAIYYITTAIFVGATMGHFFVMAAQSLYTIGYLRALRDAWVIVPIIFGVLLFARFYRPLAWLATISVSIIIGASVGLLVRGGLIVQFLTQLTATYSLKLVGVPAAQVINNLVIMLGVFTVVTYFIFTRKVANFAPVRIVSRVGRFMLLASSGVLFAGGYAFTITMALNAIEPFAFAWPGQLSFPIFLIIVAIFLLAERLKK